MRLFVAIEIVPEIREKLVGFVEKLRKSLGNARWANPEGLHITLKFLGNLADEKRTAIENALAQVEASRFAISVRRVGVFPNSRSPRVLWAGIESGPELIALAEKVETSMLPLGFTREKREFAPHVTLARFNDTRKVNLNSALAVPDVSFGTMTATEFHLYESKLSPKGSLYTQLANFTLN